MRPWRALDLTAQGRWLARGLCFDAVLLGGLAVALVACLDEPLPKWTRGALPGVLIGLFTGTAIPWTAWFHRAHCRALEDGMVPRFASHWAGYSWWLPVANLWWPFVFARALWRFHGGGGWVGPGRWADRFVPFAMQLFACGAVLSWGMALAAPATGRIGFLVAAAAVSAGACLFFARFAARVGQRQEPDACARHRRGPRDSQPRITLDVDPGSFV